MANPVRAARLRDDLTQAQLAERAGLDRATIIRAEAGKHISYISQARIARALLVDVEELFPDGQAVPA